MSLLGLNCSDSQFILELFRCGRSDGPGDHLDWQGMTEDDWKSWTERYQKTRSGIVP